MHLFLTLLLSLSPVLAHAQTQDAADTYATATVLEVVSEERDDAAGFDRTVQMLRVRFDGGESAGEEALLENAVLGERADMRLAAGDRIVVERVTRVDGSVLTLIREPYRLPSLFWLTALFFALAIVFAGRTGFASIIGLCVSIGIIVGFVVPMIGNGSNPLLIAFIGCIAIACTSLYLAHGFHMRTTIALLSTLTTLAIALVLSILAVHFTRLFGMGTEETMFLQLGPLQAVNLRGLLLGGIVIGALGVLDDITTTQTAAINELKRANPRLSRMQLYRSGLTIGREHIASLINTLALAYVGASLPLLLLFWSGPGAPWWVVLNGESIAEEIVRTLVGSSALILAVPISTWFACAFLKGTGSRDVHVHLQ